MRWRPIKTAPRDGTKILVGRFTVSSSKKGLIEVDWWRTEKDNAGFIGFGRFHPIYWPPTHWQPLPEPPK